MTLPDDVDTVERVLVRTIVMDLVGEDYYNFYEVRTIDVIHESSDMVVHQYGEPVAVTCTWINDYVSQRYLEKRVVGWSITSDGPVRYRTGNIVNEPPELVIDPDIEGMAFKLYAVLEDIPIEQP